MTKYRIKHTSVMHNGKLCKEGSVIELTELQAKKLKDFLEAAEDTKTNAATKTKKSTAKSKTKTTESSAENDTNSTDNTGNNENNENSETAENENNQESGGDE